MILAGASDAAYTVGNEQTETSPTPNQTGGGMEEDVTTTSVTPATPRSQNTTFDFKSGSASKNSSFPFKILVVAASALAGLVCMAGGTAVACLRKKKSSRTPSVRPKRPERTPIWRKKSTNKRAKKSGRIPVHARRWLAEGMVEDNLERVPLRTFGWV